VALTALQQQILRVVAEVDDMGTVALAGGGAMNVHHVSDRVTHDLDLFTPDVEHVETIAARLISALEENGMNVTRIRDTPGFIRLDVRNREERTIIELAHDYRWLDPVQTTLGLVLVHPNRTTEWQCCRSRTGRSGPPLDDKVSRRCQRHRRSPEVGQ
jgi:hypothetical protein